MKNFLSYILILSLVFSFASALPSLNAEASDAQIPEDKAVYTSSPECFKTDMTGFEKALFYLDGSFFGEADSDGRFLLENHLTYGDHILKTVKIKPDKSAEVDEIPFSIYTKTNKITQTQNFDGYDPAKEIGENINFNYGFNSDKVELNAVSGKSGAQDDMAIQFQYQEGGKNVGGWPWFRPKNFARNSSNRFNYGVLEVEFDIKLNTTDTVVCLGGFPRDKSSGNDSSRELATGGKWYKTGISTTTDWTHIKMRVDADNKKYSLWIDTVKAFDEVPLANQTAAFGYDEIKFGIRQSTASTETTRYGYAIDNFEAVHYKLYKGISKMTYIKSDAEIDSSCDIAPDADLLLYLPEGLTSDDQLKKENVNIKTLGGVDVGVSEIFYDSINKTLKLTPKQALPGGETIEVSLSGSMKFGDGTSLGGDYSIRGTVAASSLTNDVLFKAGSKILYTKEQIVDGDNVSVTVTVNNNSDSPLDVLYIFTERNGGKLISMCAKTLEQIPTGTSAETFTLSLPSPSMGAQSEYKLMVWDNYESAKAQGKIITID